MWGRTARSSGSPVVLPRSMSMRVMSANVWLVTVWLWLHRLSRRPSLRLWNQLMAAQPLIIETVSWRGNRQLQQFLRGSVLVLGWIAVAVLLELLAAFFPEVIYTRSIELFRVGTYYLMPLLAAASLWLMLQFARQGSSRMNRWELAAGVVFIAGGAFFDVAVTAIYSPDLTDEGNLFVRGLLDRGHSLKFVYVHAGLTQLFFVALFCAVWLGFLRHRPILLETIRVAQPRHGWDFVKAATGGGHLSWREWLLPLTPSEVPYLYHCVWMCAVAVVLSTSFFRWYAGLEWLGLVTPDDLARVVAVTLALIGSVSYYLAHLWVMSRRSEDGDHSLSSDAAALG